MKPDAVAPIISRELFQAVQVEHARRMRRYKAPELITLLQACYKRHGKVNASIIAADPLMPDSQIFSRTFGSLIQAYVVAGLPSSPKYAFVDTKKKLLPIREKLLSLVEALASAAGGATERMSLPFTLMLNHRWRVRVEVAVMRTPQGCSPDWRLKRKVGVDFIITARLNAAMDGVLDYFLVPVGDMASQVIYLRDGNLDRFASWRFTSLEKMFGGVTPHESNETTAVVG